MDINKYRLFADVAETNNFTKTGDRMGYTQPGVSHILKTLEEEVGFTLFVRTRKGVSLTANAQLILPYIRNLLSASEQLDQIVHDLNGLTVGHLTIASFSSISRNWLPAVLHAFEQIYPGIEIELMEGGTDEIVGWVENSVADFGLMSRRQIRELEWISLYEDPLMAILPDDSPLVWEGAVPIRELAKQPFILSAEGVDYDIHFALEEAQIKPNIYFTSKDDHAIVSMVANNLGVSILPDLVISGVRSQIRALPLEPYCTRELGIACKNLSGLTPAARRFIEVIKETLPSLTQPTNR